MSTISEEEIEREVRTLKNLRRRSASSPGPGELPLDPDLPPPDAFQHTQGQGQQYPIPMPLSSNDDITLQMPPPGSDNLFWVPAHLHPELAPGEFRAFLKQHTQVNPTAVQAGEEGEASLTRSPSWLARSRSLSGGLDRKKSMLSRQYTPRHGDKIEEEKTPNIQRRGSQRYGRNVDTGPTLKDLQKLEALVESTPPADDPREVRRVLRTSLTLNTGVSLDDKALALDGDEANSPIALPRPGSIIRRTARTKIRKGSPNEGQSRRLSYHRPRHGPRLQSPIDGEDPTGRISYEERYSGDRSSEDHRRSEDTRERGSDETSEERSSESPHTSAEYDARATPDTSILSDDTNGSIDDEALIFDAYAHGRSSSTTSSASDYDTHSRSPSPEPTQRPVVAPIATTTSSESNWFEDDELTPTQDSPMSAALQAMSLLSSSGPSEDIFSQAERKQQQQQQLDVRRQAIVRPTSPEHAPALVQPLHVEPRQSSLAHLAAQPEAYPGGLPPGMAAPLRPSPVPAKQPQSQPQAQSEPVAPAVIERPPLTRVDSAASSVSTASAARREKIKDKEKKHGGLFGKKDKKEKEKDKNSKKEKDGFLGSLFGSKKKVEDASSVSNFATAGPAAAAALLGTSKSAKSLQAQSGGSSPTSAGFNNFARYPIHVERAVYRLSHIKLANARRPLIEQVLISNLMFWYLGVIGRNPTQNEEKKGVTNGLDKDRNNEAAQNPQLKGTPPKPADTGSAGVKKDDSPPPSPVRKTGLNKPERAPRANAEAAYRSPSYDAQNAQVDKEMRSPSVSPSREMPREREPQPQSPQRERAESQPPNARQSIQHVPPAQGQPLDVNAHQPYPPQLGMGQRSQTAPARTRSPPQVQHQPREYPPGVAPPRPPSQYGPGPPRGGDPRQQRITPQGGHHSGPPPSMGGQRQYPPNARPPFPHSGKHGPQPGQIFQYPGGGGGAGQYPRPPGAGGPQPGQLFNGGGQYQHGPQGGFQQPLPGVHQQRPPQAQGQQGWQPPQRLPSGGHGQQRPSPGPGMVDAPPRRSSANQDAYGHHTAGGYGGEGQQQQPPQHFYAAAGGGQRSQNAAYQYVPVPPGTSRQPVPSGPQYPHHR